MNSDFGVLVPLGRKIETNGTGNGAKSSGHRPSEGVPEGVPGNALNLRLFEGGGEPFARVLNQPVTLGMEQGGLWIDRAVCDASGGA